MSSFACKLVSLFFFSYPSLERFAKFGADFEMNQFQWIFLSREL